MRHLVGSFVLFALSASLGCSSTTEGKASLEHVSADGAIAFEGSGWVCDPETACSRWRKGTLSIGLEIVDSLATDARQGSEKAKSTTVPILLEPTQMGTADAYWYGWRSDALGGLDVYELYMISGGRHVHVELQGPTVSQDEAFNVLSTVHTL